MRRVVVMVGRKVELPRCLKAMAGSLAASRRELVKFQRVAPRWLVVGGGWTGTS